MQIITSANKLNNLIPNLSFDNVTFGYYETIELPEQINKTHLVYYKDKIFYTSQRLTKADTVRIFTKFKIILKESPKIKPNTPIVFYYKNAELYLLAYQKNETFLLLDSPFAITLQVKPNKNTLVFYPLESTFYFIPQANLTILTMGLNLLSRCGFVCRTNIKYAGLNLALKAYNPQTKIKIVKNLGKLQKVLENTNYITQSLDIDLLVTEVIKNAFDNKAEKPTSTRLLSKIIQGENVKDITEPINVIMDVDINHVMKDNGKIIEIYIENGVLTFIIQAHGPKTLKVNLQEITIMLNNMFENHNIKINLQAKG